MLFNLRKVWQDPMKPYVTITFPNREWRCPIKEDVNKGLFAAETGQQCQIDINRFAWLPPALQGQAANEAILPLSDFADCLELCGGANDFNHAVRLS